MISASYADRPARWCLERIRSHLGNPPLQLCLGARLAVPAGGPPLLGTVRIADFGTLLKLVLEPEYQFGEGFTSGSVTVEGNLPEMLAATYRSIANSPSRHMVSRIRSNFVNFLYTNTQSGSRRNIHRHYDLGTEFYRLWLDKELVYTGAYFAESHFTLEEAQSCKMDHVCRKVTLSPGDSVVEAGCGWGALALHMARNYGARVRAFNISHDQIAFARARAKAEGLDGRVEFIEDDYRNISGGCDVFISVGMLEHVGRRRYREFAAVMQRCLGPEGRALVHFIGRNRKRPLNAWIRRRIFPGAYPPTLSEFLRVLEPFEFSVLDVENLRLHYALTLEHWLRRFESAADEVRNMFGPVFERAWRLYLAGSAASFHTGSLQLFQVALVRSTCNRIPWTRAHLYAQPSEAEDEYRWPTAMS